ncbi:hypothetical protein [Okeania sp. SIO2B3]|uniref:hypothetical protein n=1 Tax=Okeania sp. SIO2B3 TaxID=2607784 RepID=UPI0013BF49B3|nr:hypothetical protein [Okeania sp. SIO2B3]NET41121.1 hypothetical protein [Okeania sp. SIO2B3]
MICSDGDNLGGLPPPDAIILTFFVDANLCRSSCSFIACFKSFSSCSYLIPQKLFGS